MLAFILLILKNSARKIEVIPLRACVWWYPENQLLSKGPIDIPRPYQPEMNYIGKVPQTYVTFYSAP